MSCVYFVGGARPNFMKLAPIFRAWRACETSVEAKLVHTGQHYDSSLSDIFFEQLGLPKPHVTLEVGSGTHGAQTAKILERFEKTLLESKDDIRGVVVVGDVNSTIAAALAAKKLGLPVAHVEAGLRSNDRRMPEEINRLATDAISDLLLISEPSGLVNLKAEGYDESKVHYTGNVMIDSVVHTMANLDTKAACANLGVSHDQDFVLVTMHRPSNVDAKERLTNVVNTLARIAKECPVVFPIHPRTRAKLISYGLLATLEGTPNMRCLEPVGYNQMLSLMNHAKAVLTDSGGIQEETTHLRVPCFTLRPNTERPATISEGTNILVGEDLEKAYDLLTSSLRRDSKSDCSQIRGWDGNAAVRCVDVLLNAWT